MNRSMTRQWRTCILVATTLAGGFAGCDRAELTGPPTLRVGRDECVECGMMINEERCSSALLVEDRGIREFLFFDDIGCMLDYEQQPHAEQRAIERFVHDFATQQWLNARAAVFVAADRQKLTTPMASGLVAFATVEQAQEAINTYGGQTMSAEELSAARVAWQESRRAPAAQAPDAGAAHDLADR